MRMQLVKNLELIFTFANYLVIKFPTWFIVVSCLHRLRLKGM